MHISQRLRTIYQNGQFPTRAIPLGLLGVCILAFGLLIPGLGFYHDDWSFVYYDAIRGPQGIIKLFNFDGHPLTAFIYLLSFKLVGYTPIAWHIYALLWRWLAVSMFWILLDKIWPNHKHFSLGAALLFAIYPLFVLQILPISYFEIWLSFFLFFLSLYLTIRAIQEPTRFWLFTGLALAAKLGQMFTSEYTWSIEPMRLLIIWFMLPGKPSLPQKITRTIKNFLPFLVTFLAFAFWRSLLYQSGRKEIAVQASLLPQIVSLIINWLHNILPDSALILITSWFQVLDPKYLDLGSLLNLGLLFLILLSSVAVVFMLNRLQVPESAAQTNQDPAWQAILLGLSGLLLGLIPAYAIGYSVYNSAPPGNTRFALGALPAAALLILSVIQLSIASQRVRNILVALLVGLSIAWHVRYTLEFRDLWHEQVNFYRQLTWRAPDLKPGTVIIAMDNIFPPIRYPAARIAISGEYPTALALNTIYASRPGTSQAPYWFFPDGESLPAHPVPGNRVSANHIDSAFSGQRNQALLVLYTPHSPICLHLLRPSDAAYRDYPPPLRDAAKSASLDAVLTAASPRFDWLTAIAGPEDANTWCAYYQKADLAAQGMDWGTVATLWDQASQKKLTPSSGLELLPFTQAFLQRQEWDTAFSLTRFANKLTHNMSDVYCPLWKPSRAPQQILKRTMDLLACP